MRHVDFEPSKLRGEDATWWQQWSARADAEAREVQKARGMGLQRSFDPAILEELKRWLLHNVFYNKCAFCEYDAVPRHYYGDPEHYRPESEVTEVHGGHVEPVMMPDGHPHPGYYWVAHDWRNVFPLCARCGRSGKGSQFPIKAERVSDPRRGPDPEILDRIEVPQLLNPYNDHPADHLKFGVKGTVTALTDRGEASINAFHLNDEPFVVERQSQQEKAWSYFLLIARSTLQGPSIGKLLKRSMERYTGPNARFSQAVIDYLEIKVRDLA